MPIKILSLAIAACALLPPLAEGQIVFERTSAYHHIRVIDEAGLRTLSFDGSAETRVLLHNPLEGHFEYTEFFHMPWLWLNLSNVLMIGLGGGSTQRSYQHYCPAVNVETVEIDAAVVEVARNYFFVKETSKHKIHVSDGRIFLRRSTNRYDAIILDAYTENRYGSFLPRHLVTQEFFRLASQHLGTNGVLAYNVMGQIDGMRASLLGAMYRTMKSVFPEVYFFPASSSQNVVLVATKSKVRYNLGHVQQRTAWLLQSGRVTLPSFKQRAQMLRAYAPVQWSRLPILTDDYAPIEGLLAQPDH